MANLRGRKVRGGESTAFALGFSDKMKSVAGAMAVLALATTGTVVVQSQTTPAAYAQDAGPAEEAANSNEPIVADAIANGYIKSATGMTNAKSTLSGRAFIDDGYGFSPTDGGQQAVPEGTKVYMQWIDKDGAVSPVYVAQTTDKLGGSNISQAGPGAYAFDLREPWVDHHGKEHTYTASTNQYYRLWIDPFVDERNGFTVYPFRQVGGFFPGAYRNSMGANQQGAWNTIGTNMQRTAVLMQADRDVPYMHKPKGEWIEDRTPTVPNQSVSPKMKGHVGGKVWHETTDARLNGPNDNGDVPATGMFVVMSVLTEEGAGAYAAAVDTLPEAQQLAAAKKLLEEHPEYIAATVRSKIDADGRYSVKFPEGTLTKQTKQYLYAHVETADGRIPSGYSAWRIPLFNSPKNNGTRNPAPIAAANPVQNPMWYNVNFALVPRHDVKLDITNFNMTDKPADAGDTAELNVTGPFPVTPNKIVWKKNNGEIVKTCDVASAADANACTFTVPDDAKTGDIYTAQFVTGDNTVLAADSFTVVVPVVLPFGSVEEKYDEFDALSVLPKQPDNVVKGAEPTYKVEGLPEGLEFDEKTGKITGTPTKSGTSEVVVTRDIKVTTKEEVPVLDEEGNPVYVNPDAPEDERVVKTKTIDVEDVQHDRIPTLLTVTDTPLKAGVVGEDYKHKVVPTGFEDHPHELKIKDGSLAVEGLPEGLKFDPNTGEITGTPAAEVEASEKEPNVTVTYTLIDYNGTEYKITDRAPLPVSADVKTTVDDSGVKPVDPTNDEQDTGIVVTNPDDDTKVSAKDEDGKDVPVKIDEDGKIVVTPGEDVDGPITVVVEDPDLPEGKVEIEVPVNGHEKDRDDNGSETPETPDASVVTDGETVVEGQPVDPFETAKDVPENGKVTVDGLPDGLTVDEKTGEVSGTPDKLTDWGKDEEERDFEVTVTVTDENGDKVAEGTKVITVQRDTDNDGKPDVTDTDDDGDGFTDEEEKEAGTDPKDPDSKPAETPDASVVTDGETVVEGQPVDPFETAKDVPENGKVTVDGLPDGLTVDEKTGEVSGTPDKLTDWGKDEEERDFEVTVTVTDENGDKVAEGTKVITVQRDTDNDGKPDVTDTDDDGDGFTDEEEKEAGTDPKDADEVPQTPLNPALIKPVAPVFEKDDKNPDAFDPNTCSTKPFVVVKDQQGVKYTVTVDGVELTPEADGKYFYDFGKTVKVTAEADGVEFAEGATTEWTWTAPNEEECNKNDDAPSIVPGDSTDTVPADGDGHNLDDKVKNPTEDMTGEVVDKDGNPIPDAKVEIDPNTGEITVTVPEGTEPQDATVIVKDKDGNKVGEIDITITEPKKPGTGGSSTGSSDLPDGLIPGLIGGGIIGGIIGNNLGSSHGSSTPGQGAGSGHGSADKGAGQGADKGAADKGAQQGGNAGQSGAAESGQSGAAQSGASSSSSADRQGSLAVTGVSGVAIMLGAAAMALAIGGALLAGRRRREN